MRTLWRLLVMGLLLGSMTLVLPHVVGTAAARMEPGPVVVRGPAADNGAQDNGSDVDNDNDQDDNDNWSAWADNDNGDNDNAVVNQPSVPTDPNQGGQQVQSGSLTIDLWHSADHPVAGTPFRISITGSGAPIDRIWWWASGPGGGVSGDDMSLKGFQVFECGGADPCTQSWPVVANGATWYTLYARARDTSGNEVETAWHFLASSNPRN